MKTSATLAGTVAALVLAACAGSTSPGSTSPVSAPPNVTTLTSAPSPTSAFPPPAPVQPPSVDSADAGDPDSVARVVLLTMDVVDTTRAGSVAEGLRRAEPLLSARYASAVRAAPTPAPDAQWQDWTGHQAYLTVMLDPSPEDRPPDSATTAYRAFVLTSTPVGRDGWHGDPQTQIALVTLTRATSGWVVDRIDLR